MFFFLTLKFRNLIRVGPTMSLLSLPGSQQALRASNLSYSLVQENCYYILDGLLLFYLFLFSFWTSSPSSNPVILPGSFSSVFYFYSLDSFIYLFFLPCAMELFLFFVFQKITLNFSRDFFF